MADPASTSAAAPDPWLRLAPRCARAHGLDISSEMIPIARSEAAAEKIDNVTFRVGPFDDSFAAFATESPPNCYDRARLQGASP